MPNNLSEGAREWHDGARQADAQTDPKVKQQFLELERIWLSLAAVTSSPKAKLNETKPRCPGRSRTSAPRLS
jgi:hypothetical protein